MDSRGRLSLHSGYLRMEKMLAEVRGENGREVIWPSK